MTKLQIAKNKALNLWAQMCQADGVPADSKFVTFSDSNPFSAEYNAAVKHYMRLRARATVSQLNAVDSRR